MPEFFDFTLDDAPESTPDILVRGCGAAAVAVEAALDDVTGGEPRRRSLAFVVCDPDSHQSVTSAAWLANTLQQEGIFTVGVALGPCDACFLEAVDLLIRVPSSEAPAVLRPLVGAAVGRSRLPFDAVDLRWLFRDGGEAIADRRCGIARVADVSAAVDASIGALRGRGALTDESDWLLLVLRHGPAFEIGTPMSIVMAGGVEVERRTVLLGTFCDQSCGEAAELVAVARVSGAW